MKYISTKEAGEKWGLKERRVRALCQEGRVPNVIRSGRNWLIPDNEAKPLVGKARKDEIVEERLELYMNPVYCERNLHTACTEEERILCKAADLFLQGHFEETKKLLETFIKTDANDAYVINACILLYRTNFLYASNKLALIDNIATIKRLLKRNKNFYFTNKFVSYYLSTEAEPMDFINVPEKYIPAFAECILSMNVMDALAGKTAFNPIYAECICRLLNQEEQPGFALYSHVILAFYYNLLGNTTAYDYHIGKVLEIALPRKWYTPLAAYSYSLDWQKIKVIDYAAYEQVNNLSNQVINNYIQSGFFDRALLTSKDIGPQDIKIAFMIACNKSNDEIAKQLDISLYKVKTSIKKIYQNTRTSNREELSALVRSQFKIF